MTDLRSKFEKVTVLVVGDLMLDRYWWGDVTRISPEAPVPVVHLKRRSSAPGGAANVACNIGGLGAKAILLGFVGIDADAIELRSCVDAFSGVDARFIERPDVPTSVKTRIIAHSQQVVRVDQESVQDLPAASERELCDKFLELLPLADIVVISDYQKGTLSNVVLDQIIQFAKQQSKKVVVDPKGKDFSKYEGATMITPNRREASIASQLEETDTALIATVGRQLIDSLGLEAVLITRSEEGMSLFVGTDPEVHIKAKNNEIYDVTGAGDTVIATLAVAIAAGESFESAATIANTAAGIVVQHIGTSVVTIKELTATGAMNPTAVIETATDAR